MMKASENTGTMKLNFLYGENAHQPPTGKLFVHRFPFTMFIMTITKPKNTDEIIEFQTATFSTGKN